MKIFVFLSLVGLSACAPAQPHVASGAPAGPLTAAFGDLVHTPKGLRSLALEGFSEDLNQDGFVDPIGQAVVPVVHHAPVVTYAAAPVVTYAAAPVKVGVAPAATTPLVYGYGLGLGYPWGLGPLVAAPAPAAEAEDAAVEVARKRREAEAEADPALLYGAGLYAGYPYLGTHTTVPVHTYAPRVVASSVVAAPAVTYAAAPAVTYAAAPYVVHTPVTHTQKYVTTHTTHHVINHAPFIGAVGVVPAAEAAVEEA